jgi:hypothetical protein
MKYLVAIHHPDNFDPSQVDKATVHDISALNEELMAKYSSRTGHILRPRSTSVVFGYWNAQTWTRRWRGRAKASLPPGGGSRCESYSSNQRHRKPTEQHKRGAIVRRRKRAQAMLLTCPVFLGKGKRFFADGTPPRELALVASKAGLSGLVPTTCKPKGPLPTGTHDIAGA